MKTSLCSIALVALAVFALSTPGWGQACSNASLSGLYGYVGSGTNASGNPVAFEGILRVNGKGGFTGRQTESVDGVISLNVAITGTYTINSNCNGSMIITPTGGTATNYNLTVASSGGRTFGVETDSGTVITMYSRAVEETSCTSVGTTGTFGFSGVGSIVGTGGFASSGQLTLNGAGLLSGTESISEGGKISQNVAFTGTYKVNTNCTGVAVLKAAGMPTMHISFTLVRQLASLFFIETDSGTVVVGADRE